ncbi:MAG: hypothetical protein J5985_08415 [Kiritimatiellae bacterium]|nr:hypothetical protein [Kiritimatiellia bacterium]
MKKRHRWKIDKTLLCNKDDIVITDPCYLPEGIEPPIPHEEWWDFVHKIFEKGGIERYTVYGDWYCTVYRSKRGHFGFVDKTQQIGEFSADACKVCVCKLRQILEYNPYFLKWAKAHKNCVTIIRGFSGKVHFIEREEKPDENGDSSTDLRVHGDGLKNQEPFAFESVELPDDE